MNIIEKTTIYTLAKELGMTPSMVSRALSSTGKVKKEKRLLVENAAKKHGFVLNKHAAVLSKCVEIGVVIYCKSTVVEKELLEGLKQAQSELSGFNVKTRISILDSSIKEPWQYKEEVLSMKDCTGIILSGFGSEKCNHIVSELYEHNKNLAFVQSTPHEDNCLFTSKHDEKTASAIAADFISNCLSFTDNKNVVLFTGNTETVLHANAKAAFLESCENNGIAVLECVDMKDDEKILEEKTVEIFEKYGEKIGGIYITSGNCLSLCRYVREKIEKVCLVTFDRRDELDECILDGTVNATMLQNVPLQMKNAYNALCRVLFLGENPQKVMYTPVSLVMKSEIIKMRNAEKGE